VQVSVPDERTWSQLEWGGDQPPHSRAEGVMSGQRETVLIKRGSIAMIPVLAVAGLCYLVLALIIRRWPNTRPT
jgi:hypothetical protein